jgi:hypothetical protein
MLYQAKQEQKKREYEKLFNDTKNNRKPKENYNRKEQKNELKKLLLNY